MQRNEAEAHSEQTGHENFRHGADGWYCSDCEQNEKPSTFEQHTSKSIDPADLPTVCQVNGRTFETGCYVDGHWGQYGSSRVLQIADDIFGTAILARSKAFARAGWFPDRYELGCMTDELSFSECVGEMADEAESKLNDATDEGFGWGWEDGEFFLRASTEERFAAYVETVHRDSVAVLDISNDGRRTEVSADVFGFVGKVRFSELDEDGDETEDGYTVWAGWRGGVYVDLYTVGGDAEDFDSGASGFVLSDAVEVLNLSHLKTNDRDHYTAEMARQALNDWSAEYVRGESAGSLVHDFSHYGFGG